MAGFKVTPDELNTGKGNLERVAAQIEAELANAQSEVQRLVGDAWSGAARDQFETTMQEWNRLAKAQQENLAQVAGLLGEAARVYAEAEQAAQSAFNR